MILGFTETIGVGFTFAIAIGLSLVAGTIVIIFWLIILFSLLTFFCWWVEGEDWMKFCETEGLSLCCENWKLDPIFVKPMLKLWANGVFILLTETEESLEVEVGILLSVFTPNFAKLSALSVALAYIFFYATFWGIKDISLVNEAKSVEKNLVNYVLWSL